MNQTTPQSSIKDNYPKIKTWCKLFHFFPNSKLNNPQRKIVYILLGQDTELLTKIHDSIFKYNGFGMNFVNMNVYSNDSTENSLEQHSSELYDGAIYAYSKPHFNWWFDEKFNEHEADDNFIFLNTFTRTDDNQQTKEYKYGYSESGLDYWLNAQSSNLFLVGHHTTEIANILQLLTYYNNHNPDKPVRIVMMYLQPKSINQKQDTYLHSLLDSNITPNIILKYNGALTATTFITDLDKKNVHEKHFIKLSKQPLDAIATYIQYNWDGKISAINTNVAIKQFRSKIVSKSQGSITEQIDFENLNYGIDDYFDTPPLDKDKIKDEKTL